METLITSEAQWEKYAKQHPQGGSVEFCGRTIYIITRGKWDITMSGRAHVEIGPQVIATVTAYDTASLDNKSEKVEVMLVGSASALMSGGRVKASSGTQVTASGNATVVSLGAMVIARENSLVIGWVENLLMTDNSKAILVSADMVECRDSSRLYAGLVRMLTLEDKSSGTVTNRKSIILMDREYDNHATYQAPNGTVILDSGVSTNHLKEIVSGNKPTGNLGLLPMRDGETHLLLPVVRKNGRLMAKTVARYGDTVLTPKGGTVTVNPRILCYQTIEQYYDPLLSTGKHFYDSVLDVDSVTVDSNGAMGAKLHVRNLISLEEFARQYV